MAVQEALRITILFVGWPGMAVVSGFVLWSAWRFHQRVRGSPFGRLVMLMEVGWVLTMAFLAFLATLLLQRDPRGAGPLAAGFLAFWAGTMALIVWIVHRWGAEAVTINLYYAELAAMDRIKSQLINTVAHELNTPLTPVLLKLSLLKNPRLGPLTPDQRKVVGEMERNLGRLQLLVEQVMLATQLQSGTLVLAPVPVPARAWLEEVAQRFAAQAAAEGRALAVEADEATVPVDRSRMDRVLAGLLDNALRYSPKGSPVRLRGAAQDGRYEVSVQDRGQGFTAEQAAILFQPFRHARGHFEEAQAGAGLSLYLARGVVVAHGGQAWAASPGPGLGATFSFSLPMA